jgi:nitric oxide reductase large subunit
MKIYVQSRGFSQDYDYCWLPEVPPILRQYRINDLIQSESPSVVLGRYDNKLLLLVTGLEASERTDFQGRKIRNSVAWVGEDSEANEHKLRAIAASSLRGLLDTDLDKAVKFGGESGFEVFFDTISHLKVDEVRHFDAKLESKIGKNSEYLRNDALKQANVWRGLSNLVQGEGWLEPYKKSYPSESALASSSQTHQKNNSLVFVILLIAVIPVFMILFLFIR